MHDLQIFFMLGGNKISFFQLQGMKESSKRLSTKLAVTVVTAIV